MHGEHTASPASPFADYAARERIAALERGDEEHAKVIDSINKKLDRMTWGVAVAALALLGQIGMYLLGIHPKG